MRVWTNGTLHVARSRRGVYVLRGTQVIRFIKAPSEERLLAVTPSGSHAWVEGLRRLDLETGESAPGQSREVLDMIGMAQGVTALLREAAGVRLVQGEPGGAWSRELPLRPGAPTRLQAPAGMGSWGWAEPVLPSSFEPRGLVLCGGAHGVTVCCRRSGLVAVLRQEGGLCWYQAPVVGAELLGAVPTEAGVLVSMGAGAQGFVGHFSGEGRCLGHSGALQQSVGAAMLSEGRFVAFDSGKGRVKIFRLEDGQDLHPRSRLTLPSPPRDLWVSGDGRSVIFGCEDSVSIFEMNEKRLGLVASIQPESVLRDSTAKAREKQRIEQGGHYKRPEGPPALGFPASKAPIPPWEAPASGSLELALSLRSTGGVGQGIHVELSGPALAQGLVLPLEVEVAGQKATPVQRGQVWGCALPAVELPQGMNFPFEPKPKTAEQTEKAQILLAATHLPLCVRLATSAPGSAMLSVAVWPSQGSAAPMKWTRLLVIHG
jgi:hypothetical protein